MKYFIYAVPALICLPVSAATLQLDENIQLLAINGQAPMAQQARTLDLEPGYQAISIRYSGLIEYGHEDHEFIRSGVHVLKFDATAGQNYRLQLPDMNLKQARSFAKQPSFTLTAGELGVVSMKQCSHDQLLAQLTRPE